MKIHAVATIYNEEDIIPYTLSHLFNNGIDHIWIAHGPSTDHTLEAILSCKEGPITILNDHDEYHYQPKWINEMTQMARRAGADWVIPFDADEFWCTNESTLHEYLSRADQSVPAVYAPTYIYTNWFKRNPDPQRLGKVAFRPTKETIVSNGNHMVSGIESIYATTIHICEIQFRSLEHLHRKSEERTIRLDPTLPPDDGIHQKILHAMTSEQREAEWREKQAQATVYDPIPYRGTVPLKRYTLT